ncbi:transcription elongation factor B polypeptide 3 [Stomoxys calcitrans]|uniref:transcription elongation factor B polypeptide 3 n=1 Tax=Stomoxys calcitrans TaxID=35570 RepID=UPI0027E22187|nr:transcription elongation factor B polypeptide 3 [Stomoxys calcitrans]
MTTSIVEVIQHYQRSIDNSQDNEARLLYCIQKLYKLPIKVEHLQETGVGKTVNSLRKFNGEIGVAAKSLVTKWKAMVAAEEEPMDTTPQSYENESHHNDHGGAEPPSPHNNNPEEEEDDANLNHTTTTQHNESKHSGHSEKDRHKERNHGSSSTHHKESSNKHSSSSSSKHSNDKHKTSSSSSSSSSRDKEAHHKSSSGSKEREKEKTEHKSRDKHKEKDHQKDRERSEKRKEEKHKSEKESKTDLNSSHKHSSSSKNKSEDSHNNNHRSSSKEKGDKERTEKHKSSSKDRDKSKEEKTSSSSKEKNDRKSTSSSTSHKSSSSSSTKEPSESTERKRRHNSDTESIDFKSPQPKVAKTQKSSSSAKASPTEDDDGEDDCFDSSMGTNFGDILGMLNMPTSKKSKKSNKTPASEKDSPPKPSTSNKKNGMNASPVVYSPVSTSKPTTSKPTTAKPDLLSSTAKLEPLDPNIALELPTISTNYKPMPLNQTVMDCVFNTTSSSSKPMRTLTDAEALHHGISSKTMRTKIYSGSKTGQIFQVPSLFDMCIRILQKNIDALEYTGGVPFEVLRPVLERATPEQLYEFEDYNRYLMEDSDVLWQVHVSRKFRTQKRLENESWREMFIRCQEEEERRLSFLKDSIKQSQKIAAAPVRKTQLAFVDSMVKPPRNVMRKQEQYGTKAKLVATPAARVASLQNATPNAAKSGDQRLKVSPAVRDNAQVSSSVVRNKKAPLMQKTLAFMRGRLKR